MNNINLIYSLTVDDKIGEVFSTITNGEGFRFDEALS